jgi:hypothetical protein
MPVKILSFLLSIALWMGCDDAPPHAAPLPPRTPPTGPCLPAAPPLRTPAVHEDDATLTPLADGTVLVAGGRKARGGAAVFHPDTGAWIPAGSMYVSRHGHSATRLPDGKVLILGGVENDWQKGTADLYHPKVRRFEPFELAKGVELSEHAAVLLDDGDVLVVTRETSWRFSPAGRRWKRIATPPGENADPVLLPLPSGKRLLLARSGRVAIFEPGSNTWRAGPRLPVPLEHIASVALANGDLFVVGRARNALLFDVRKRRWEGLPPMPAERRSATATLLASGEVLVTGSAEAGSQADLFDPVRRQWIAVAPVPSFSLSGHAAVRLADGRALFAGGTSERDTAVFDPRCETFLQGYLTSASIQSVAPLADHRAFVLGEGFAAIAESPRRVAHVARPPVSCRDAVAVAEGTGAVLAVGCGPSTLRYELLPRRWTTAGPAPALGKLVSHAVVGLPGELLVMGGLLDHKPVASVLRFRIGESKPRPGAAMLTARYQHSAARLPDGRVLVTGGRTSEERPLASAEIYDPAKDRWTAAPPMPAPRAEHHALSSPQGVLVAGGVVPEDKSHAYAFPTAELWRFEIGSARWVHGHELDHPRSQVRPILAGESPWVTFDKGDEVVTPAEPPSALADSKPTPAVLEALDPPCPAAAIAAPRCASSPASPLPWPRAGLAAAWIAKDQILVTGGENEHKETRTAALFDSNAGTWRVVAEMKQARQRHAMVALLGGRVLVAGGGKLTADDELEILDIASGTWTKGPSDLPRQDAAAVRLGDGRVLIAGGVSWYQSSLEKAAVYDPAHNRLVHVPLRQKRAAPAAALLPDGRVLVAGGKTNEHSFVKKDSDEVLAHAEIFDPAESRFTKAEPMRTPRYHHAMVALSDGRVLVAGGRSMPVYLHPKGAKTIRIGDIDKYARGLASAEIFDPRTGTWHEVAPMKEPRYHHTLTLLSDGRVLAAGGYPGHRLSTALSSAEIYDPRSNTWTLASLRLGRGRHAALALPDGRAILFGGRAGTSPLEDVEVWSPSLECAVHTKPVLREGPSALRLRDGTVIVAGGSDERHNPLASIERYVGGVWHNAGGMRIPRERHSATLVADGRVLFAGGISRYGVVTNSAEVWDPQTMESTQVPSMAAPRSWHRAVRLLDGRVLVVGGLDGDAPIASAEIYDPQARRWTLAAPVPLEWSRTVALTLLGDGRPLALSAGRRVPYVLDLDRARWLRLPPAPERADITTFDLLPDGRFLSLGRHGFVLFDPAKWAWSTMRAPEQGRMAHTTVRLRDGRLLAFGDAFHKDPILFDPAKERWTEGPSASPSFNDATAVALCSGIVLVVAGRRERGRDQISGDYLEAMQYDPSQKH